jgi:hypothetical protein
MNRDLRGINLSSYFLRVLNYLSTSAFNFMKAKDIQRCTDPCLVFNEGYLASEGYEITMTMYSMCPKKFKVIFLKALIFHLWIELECHRKENHFLNGS